MKVFRLTRKKYAEILNGKGASKSGNRWNSKGTEIIYTAESRSLAMAELVVVAVVVVVMLVVVVVVVVAWRCLWWLGRWRW